LRFLNILINSYTALISRKTRKFRIYL